MQVLKTEIKETINEAALNCFFQNGFKQARMADIAEDAGLSVGNLYHYYKNKKDLFYAVIPEEFANGINAFIRNMITATDGLNLETVREEPGFMTAGSRFESLMIENRKKVVIILEKAGGTKYEKSRTVLVDFLEGLYIRHLKTVKKSVPNANQKKVIRIVYTNYLQTIVDVLKLSSSEKILRESLSAAHAYHLGGLAGMMK
ncbi:MAG: TetR/AcrR family transcriptional regulator [bacterium]|nr:TetR/AcrR family transcriptional regulator [bacterium]